MDKVTDFIGLAGVAVIIATYYLLQSGRMKSDSVAYSASNAAGAGLVMISLFFDFNLSAFIVEVFWVAISLYGVFRHLRR